MRINKPAIVVAAAVVIAAAGTGYYLHSRHAPALPPPLALQVPAPPEPAEAAIQHPLPEVPADSAPKTPLPALADSDPSMLEALSQAAGAATVKEFLLPENFVRHMVVTIDNLPRQKVAVEKRPTIPVAGSFAANGDELHATLDPQNFARYQPMVAAVSMLDAQKLADVYIRFYPLFQRAYQDLGYPNGYFNDRLVQVIDDLLAAPQPAGPLELIRPNVMYLYADPALESRSAGQKLLIRMGPQNAAAIKAKLTELRAVVAAAAPKR